MNGAHQRGMRVLVVEDEPACRNVVKEMLSSRGVKVTACPDAEQAIKLLLSSVFDAVLVDLRLPGMDGISLLRHIRSVNPDLPVILMTGYSSVSSAVDALKLGAHDYIIKPIENADKLFNTVGTSVERYRLIAGNRKLQEQLRISEQKYRVIFENATDMIVVVSLDGQGLTANLLDANNVACCNLGLKKEDLQKLPFLDLVTEHRRKDTEAFLTTTSPATCGYETFLKTAGNTLLPVDIKATRLSVEARDLLMIIARDISERRRLEQDIADASERDRRHLGRELHDALSQDLTSVTILAASLQQRLATECSNCVADAKMIHEISKRAISFCRRLCSGLFPVEIESDGLIKALETLARETQMVFRVECSVAASPEAVPKDSSIALHLFRITQEAVANAVRHGKATRIRISLSNDSDGRSCLLIEDNGKGLCSPAGEEKHFGLRIMEYRARVIGGILTAASSKQGGTVVSCIWR